MYGEPLDLRKDGFVIIIGANCYNVDFILIRNLDELRRYVTGSGWESVEEFERAVGHDRSKIIGQVICYTGSRLYYIEDEDWYKRIDIARIRAVFNKYVLNNKNMTAEEVGEQIIILFSHLCGEKISQEIQEIIKSKLDSEPVWETTGEFIELIFWKLIHFFKIK